MRERMNLFSKYGKKYKFTDQAHPLEYCKLEKIPNTIETIKTVNKTEMSQIMPYQDPNATEPFNSWKVFCHCNGSMPLRRLKSDFSIYKTCHCGSRFDIKTYQKDTYLYICNTCNLTHEAYQYTMKTDAGETLTYYQPVGIPSSEKCKNVRLHSHQLIKYLTDVRKMNKGEVYELISKLSNKERHLAHVGKFDIGECYDLIMKLQDYIFCSY